MVCSTTGARRILRSARGFVLLVLGCAALGACTGVTWGDPHPHGTDGIPQPTQTCPDGSVIPLHDTCPPVPPPPNPPSLPPPEPTQVCPDGTTIPLIQSCPTPKARTEGSRAALD
ncbi:MAG TPA: hypothetical protein VGF77_02810 [Allosphingosinicella sp.]|jgi:hypothetical protein